MQLLIDIRVQIIKDLTLIISNAAFTEHRVPVNISTTCFGGVAVNGVVEPLDGVSHLLGGVADGVRCIDNILLAVCKPVLNVDNGLSAVYKHVRHVRQQVICHARDRGCGLCDCRHGIHYGSVGLKIGINGAELVVERLQSILCAKTHTVKYRCEGRQLVNDG